MAQYKTEPRLLLRIVFAVVNGSRLWHDETCSGCPEGVLIMPADGFDTSRLAEVAMTLQQGVDMGQCAGLVTATWRKGKLEQLNVMGYRNVESKAPMRRDTIFRIASMTKPITAAAILILLDEGKLRLDDPIKQWAPEFANARVLNTPLSDLSQTHPATRDIIIEDLLTHRSGLSYGF